MIPPLYWDDHDDEVPNHLRAKSMTPEEVQEAAIERIMWALKECEPYMGAVEQVKVVRLALSRLADDYYRDGAYVRADVLNGEAFCRSDKNP